MYGLLFLNPFFQGNWRLAEDLFRVLLATDGASGEDDGGMVVTDETEGEDLLVFEEAVGGVCDGYTLR